MKTISHILIAKNVGGHWQKVSDTGRLYESREASHPLKAGKAFGMTEAEHLDICRAAAWLYDEPGAVSADLESGYRVSLY